MPNYRIIKTPAIDLMQIVFILKFHYNSGNCFGFTSLYEANLSNSVSFGKIYSNCQ